jgi:hypothetical protein
MLVVHVTNTSINMLVVHVSNTSINMLVVHVSNTSINMLVVHVTNTSINVLVVHVTNTSINKHNRVAAVSITSLLYFTNSYGFSQLFLSGLLQVCLHTTRKKKSKL